jgi:phosphotransferase system  glucose/maltose/N-acetylglucosamine-specific IIC component
MKGLLMILTKPTLVLSAVAIFVVLFVAIHRTLKEMSLFKSGTSVVVALCVALLCMIGLQHFLVSGEGGHAVYKNMSESNSKTGIQIILLPYAALAITMLLCLLLLTIARIFAGRRQEEYPARQKATVTKSEKHQNKDEEKRIRK